MVPTPYFTRQQGIKKDTSEDPSPVGPHLYSSSYKSCLEIDCQGRTAREFSPAHFTLSFKIAWKFNGKDIVNPQPFRATFLMQVVCPVKN